MPDIVTPTVVPVGENPTRLWGMTSAERIRRIARAAGLPTSADLVAGAVVLTNVDFAFDPAWLRHIARLPDTALTCGGRPVIVHLADREKAEAVRNAMQRHEALPAELGLTIIAYEEGGAIENRELRKRERPFLGVLEPGSVAALERASYVGAYKGVTDLLTKYLWPEWAFVLTRLAARLGLSPNMVTALGAILCIGATIAFWHGHYWMGLIMGLVFMVLDTVDGKLARCTITSSWWGNIFDHGMDLIHPPFWWWGWAVGLGAWGLALSEDMFWLVQGTMLAGYILQRVTEGIFIRAFGMHIHVWRKFDSDFRLITARRNPNMIILFVATLFQRPDIGIVAVAGWTAFSMLVHFVRIAQAFAVRRREGQLLSWLAS